MVGGWEGLPRVLDMSRAEFERQVRLAGDSSSKRKVCR